MATKKKAAKPAAKKPAAKPAKKVIPAKKPAAKPAKKPAKPVAKKPVAKPAKKAAPAKKPVKKAVKPVAKKPAPKPVKKAVAAKKPAPKSVVAPKKPLPKPVQKTEPKKEIIKPVMSKEVKKEVKPLKPVVIPKITTKTVKKYSPDFTKSVLDQKPVDFGASIVRYSDNDLAEFRELIQRKLEAAKKELGYLQGLITRKDEMGGDDTDNRYMTMEDGSLSMEREQLSQMASRQITFIDHLEKALMRIENKTYGICRVTGKLIDKARLRAVPHATLSIEAKMGIVR
jgi:RNA polymerase-binding transcription factor DksA